MHRTIIHHHHPSLSLLAFEECHSMLDDAEEKANALLANDAMMAGTAISNT